MRLNLLSSFIIAITAIAIIPAVNSQNAAHKNASSSSTPSALEVAARSERNIFRGYVAFLVLAAIGTAALTVWLRGANAKYLEAVREDARVRISTVESNAKIEAQRVENEANVRIQKVKSDAGIKIGEQHNLALDLQAKLASAVAESRAKQADLEREQQKTATVQSEAAKAQLALEKYATDLASRGWPRSLDGKRFLKRLEGRPKARVELLYDPYTPDSWVLARDIYWWLGKGIEDSHGAGWDVSSPKPIPADAKLQSEPSLSDAPPAMRFSGAFTKFGLTVRMRYLDAPAGVRIPKESDCVSSPQSRLCIFGAREALVEAMMVSILPEEHGGDIQMESDEAIPEGTIIVVVGPKPPFWPFEFKPNHK